MNIEELLKNHKLRVTQTRLLVLNEFSKKMRKGITSTELLSTLAEQIDKVTLYRTLHTFEEKQLIHRIFDNSGIEKYALCVGTCDHDHSNQEHSHAHLHFKCEKCDETECLAEIDLPKIALPNGYIEKTSNFVIGGVCARCS